MKKVLLGIFLSAGSFAFAGNSVCKSYEGIDIEVNNSSILNCLIRTRVSLVDANGNSGGYRDYFTEGQGSQCDGAVGNMVHKEVEIKLAGSFTNTNEYNNN